MSRAVTAPALALALGLALAGCGLPLPGGVQEQVGEVSTGTGTGSGQTGVDVLPPGPEVGATPEQVVRGFLRAQSSPADDHRVARSFLTGDLRLRWDDSVSATVYDGLSTVGPPPGADDGGEGEGATATRSVELSVVGTIGPDGVATAQPRTAQTQTYQLRREAGQWRLSEVPPGLTLAVRDRDATYRTYAVHFLAPAVPPGSTRHLVADLLHLPADEDPAQELVERVLAGPSSALGASAQTAVPAGTVLAAPVATSASGEVTVDLAGPVADLPDADRQDLSAQLVWTLRQVPVFTRLRLLVDGEPLPVPGVPEPQPKGAWADRSPDGPAERPPAFALTGGMLTRLGPRDDDRSEADVLPEQGVRDYAVSPSLQQVAVLTGAADARSLRTGGLDGPLGTALSAPGLVSPTWGRGDDGVWFLRTDRQQVAVLPGGGPGEPEPVAVPGLPRLAEGSLLRVSPDGVRVALVGADGVLRVGRLERGVEGGRRVAALRAVLLPGAVLDVAWRTSTSMSVLVQDTDAPRLPLLVVPADGVQVGAPVGLLGAGDGAARAVAASGEQPVLVETRSAATGVPSVYADDGRGFELRVPGASRPSYPR